MIVRNKLPSKVEATVLITGANDEDWYKELVGKSLKVRLYKDDGRAQSSSMKMWINRDHFKVIKGQDPRTVEVRTGVSRINRSLLTETYIIKGVKGY